MNPPIRACVSLCAGLAIAVASVAGCAPEPDDYPTTRDGVPGSGGS